MAASGMVYLPAVKLAVVADPTLRVTFSGTGDCRLVVRTPFITADKWIVSTSRPYWPETGVVAY